LNEAKDFERIKLIDFGTSKKLKFENENSKIDFVKIFFFRFKKHTSKQE
jgi:hypothetical protein